MPVCGVVWGLRGLVWVDRLARLRVDWPPAIGRLFGRGLTPVGWAGLIGPGVCWGWPVCWGRLAGVCSDWGGLFGPRLIGTGLAPGQLGGAGRLGENLM
jgi:hypothetical protein